MKRLLIVLVGITLILSCVPKAPKEEKKYKKLCDFQIRKIIDDLTPQKQGISSWTILEKSLKNTLNYLSKRKKNEIILPGLKVTTSRLEESISALLEILPDLDRDPYLLEKKFDWFELKPSTFFTGYFEMDIEASLTKNGKYNYPIYGVPKDLKRTNLGRFHPRWKGQVLVYRIEGDKIEPYYTREEIEKYKAITDKAPVLAWAKNPVDVFFLQIQGSGRLILPDGTYKYIGYAGKNGRQYVSLGKYMIEKGYLTRKQANIEGIIDYLNSHPELLPDILYVNPSYVFFRMLEDGPYGAIGVKLMPMVSLATDPALIPLGGLGIYDVKIPVGKKRQRRVKGIFISQDVGGAISGNHVDLFCGFGKDARYIAGNLSQYGKIYLLLKKN
jgi:membrane-bound lytic murein transglycosylase A